jgi:hypothetical protein
MSGSHERALPGHGDHQTPNSCPRVPHESSQANMPWNNVVINPDDALMLLFDHQSGLANLIKDTPVPDPRRNVIALATVAMPLKIPAITTGSISGRAL